mmetsp:Transcript_22601/g.49477  ORF Transcript_22601/g.49477 Transcript_22601/m.49477 type:complete len:85 (+) Transcript_22601:1718-1972(+)
MRTAAGGVAGPRARLLHTPHYQGMALGALQPSAAPSATCVYVAPMCLMLHGLNPAIMTRYAHRKIITQPNTRSPALSYGPEYEA